MFHPDALVHRSFRRSRVRVRIMLALLAHGELHTAGLAHACETSPDMIAWAMAGTRPFFAPELSPVALGFVTSRARLGFDAFSLTPEGAQVAAALRADLRRAGGG